ncbi:MAG TPA: hypothetical protein VF384_05980 [Planctomycetota bacterium]
MRARPAIVLSTPSLWLALAAAAQQPVEVPRIESPFGTVERLHQPPKAPEPKFTLWVSYPHERGDFPDHEQYLAELQRRFSERGVAIAVVMPAPAAKRVAARTPGFAVAATPAAAAEPVPEPAPPNEGDPDVQIEVVLGHVAAQGPSAVLCRGEAADRLTACFGLDGAVDLLQACADDKLGDAIAQPFDDVVPGLLAAVIDSGDFAANVAQCVEAWPRSGRVRAMAVLFHWWCRGDLEAAHEAFEQGTKALATEAVPMVLFADLVLRGDRFDPRIAKTLAVLLGPLAAASPDGAFTQLVYLRALLRAGQDRIAGRTAAVLPKHLEGRPWDQLVFAETLMEAGTPAAYRDAAEKAIKAAEAGVDARLLCAVRHKVLVRCGDLEAAEKSMVEYRAKHGGLGNLNNDAWYMMVRPDTLGRFDTFALSHCEEMQRSEGAGLSYGNQDTVALALFLNGKVAEAVELQTAATAASNQDPRYVGRRTRFQAVLDEQQKQKGAEPKK